MSPSQPARIDFRRYRKVRRFVNRTFLHVLWWDMFLNVPGLRRFRRPAVARWTRIARHYRILAAEMGGVLIKLGQFLSVRVDLLPVKERVFLLYRDVAAGLLPSPDLWGIWTPREILDHVRSRKPSGALGTLTDFVEEMYFSARVPDEAVLPAQALASAIEGTPHMMGGGMRYAGWFALRVPTLTDEASGAKVKEALTKVAGVKNVAIYPAQHSAAVLFSSQGTTSSQQVLDSLKEAGIEATRF